MPPIYRSASGALSAAPGGAKGKGKGGALMIATSGGKKRRMNQTPNIEVKCCLMPIFVTGDDVRRALDELAGWEGAVQWVDMQATPAGQQNAHVRMASLEAAQRAMAQWDAAPPSALMLRATKPDSWGGGETQLALLMDYMPLDKKRRKYDTPSLELTVNQLPLFVTEEDVRNAIVGLSNEPDAVQSIKLQIQIGLAVVQFVSVDAAMRVVAAYDATPPSAGLIVSTKADGQEARLPMHLEYSRVPRGAAGVPTGRLGKTPTQSLFARAVAQFVTEADLTKAVEELAQESGVVQAIRINRAHAMSHIDMVSLDAARRTIDAYDALPQNGRVMDASRPSGERAQVPLLIDYHGPPRNPDGRSGLLFIEGGGSGLDPEMEAKLDRWVRHKREKQFDQADALREEIRAQGVDPDVVRPGKGKGKVGKGKGLGKAPPAVAWTEPPLGALPECWDIPLIGDGKGGIDRPVRPVPVARAVGPSGDAGGLGGAPIRGSAPVPTPVGIVPPPNCGSPWDAGDTGYGGVRVPVAQKVRKQFEGETGGDGGPPRLAGPRGDAGDGAPATAATPLAGVADPFLSRLPCNLQQPGMVPSITAYFAAVQAAKAADIADAVAQTFAQLRGDPKSLSALWEVCDNALLSGNDELRTSLGMAATEHRGTLAALPAATVQGMLARWDGVLSPFALRKLREAAGRAPPAPGGAVKTAAPPPTALAPGDEAEALFGADWHACRVENVHPDGLLDVQWDEDGTYTAEMAPSSVRRRRPPSGI